MRVRRLWAQGFGGLADGVYDMTVARGRAHPLVAVTGPAASGKTSLLRALVAAKEDVGAYDVRPSRVVREGEDAAKLVLSWELDDEEQLVAGLHAPTIDSESIYGGPFHTMSDHHPGLAALAAHYQHGTARGKWVYLPAPRGLALETPSLSGDPRRLALREDATKFAMLPAMVVDACRDEGPRFVERFAEVFASLCATRRFEGFDRRLVFGDAKSDVGIEQLSLSEQQAFLAAALVCCVGLARSVILIDTPELGLAYERVVPFVDALSRAADQSQLIVATTHPGLLERIPHGARIELAATETEQGRAA